MKITRLRLSGFKSFVDPTELQVAPGLTGIVGPNGCGKSNLLEALRWAMGETSPKSLRGAGMDDVIFQGTAGRPMRHMAEVTLVIDNSARLAPAAFNAHDELDITRRIEREAGSIFRINGREVRHRDVQLLFADASTGAHSPALVRQGQISQIINAKPIQRRAILEEAAGISGLHSRRHEAELRLKGAETNLTRLTDVLQELEGQLAQLRKQARQATRYRNLSELLRTAEALGHHLRWQEAADGAAAAEGELAQRQGDAAGATEAAAEASRRQAEAQAALPPLREAEAARAAALHRLSVARDALAQEEAQVQTALARLGQRIAQSEADLGRERSRAEDAGASLARLAAEADTIAAAEEGAAETAAGAAQAREAAETALAAVERALEGATGAAAALAAERRAAEEAQAAAIRRLEGLDAQIAAAQAQAQQLARELEALPDLAEAEAARRAAEDALEAARAGATRAEDQRIAATSAERAARDALLPLERQLERLKAEAQTLEKLLRAGTPDLFPPLIDALAVAPGFEAALGAALGDDLVAPLDEAAPLHWHRLAPYDAPAPLPEGVTPLSELVRGPAALDRRLGQTGIVAPEDGRRLQVLLKPGQRLVTREGALWRWDGYTAGAEAPTVAALRLAQRNRLAELDGEIGALDRRLHEHRSAAEAAHLALLGATSAEHEARSVLRAADAALTRARDRLQQIERDATARAARLSGAEASLARLGGEMTDAKQAEAEAAARRAALSDGAELAARIAALRTEVAEARHIAAQARAADEALAREAALRARRSGEIAREAESWRARAESAAQQIAALTARLAEDGAEQQRLAALPGEIAEKRARLLDAVVAAEAERQGAADALAGAEQALAVADREARQTGQVLSAAREARARAEALLDAARSRLQEIAQRIRETLACEPAHLLALAGHAPGDSLPLLGQVEERLERLRREREALGGVNLRAEDEAQELQQRLEQMQGEKTDLEAAIAKLRGGIQSLNREGRERLLGAFAAVNAQFKRLFASLFGGGEAELTLVESDDPLEAGLEILARPPGKKLASISLLSGGEQALTALSLIFAVFLSNPAPICVLDEVDAPLDDANVERFCNLLDEMVAATDTRFLIITHHALTMSRMHRLFGVTMVERGVSRLVSVDLKDAERVLAAE